MAGFIISAEQLRQAIDDAGHVFHTLSVIDDFDNLTPTEVNELETSACNVYNILLDIIKNPDKAS